MQKLSVIFRLTGILTCLLLPLVAAAQGWQRFYGNSGDQRAFSVRLMTDGGLAAIGSTADTVAGETDWYFLRTDSAGNIQTEKHWGATGYAESGIDLFPFNNHLVAIGNMNWPTILPGGITSLEAAIWNKISLQGDFISGGQSNEFISQVQGAETMGTDLLLAGSKGVGYFDSFFPQPYLVVLDSSGTIKWSKSYSLPTFGYGITAIAVDPNKILFAQNALYDTANFTIKIKKTNALGDSLFEKTVPLPAAKAEQFLHRGSDVFLVGGMSIPQSGSDVFIAKIDTSTLDTVWTTHLALPGIQTPHDAILLPNGHLAIAGEHISTGSSSRDGFLAETDAAGNLLWHKTLGGTQGDIFWDVELSPDGNGFILAGQTGSFSATGDLQAWLVRTDSLGNVWSNKLIGKVARDVVENCVLDNGEPPLSQWIVTAAGNAGTLYTNTDSLGNYAIEVDTGAWYLSVLPPSGYWAPCEDSILVSIQALGDSIATDIPVQAAYACPLLDVDLGTPFLRRCFENNFYVHYFNYGTITAPNALISIVLDPYLTATSATIPYTQSGDTLLFSVGEVPWLTGGDFQFSATLDCDSTVLGQVHCTEARIFPDSLCYNISPDWDGAHLELNGYCAGDSVVLTVKNSGAGMAGTVNYIITEDQIIFRMETLQLLEGQDTTFVIYPGGATVTMIVTQTPGHPGNSQPMLVIEGCGGSPFSTGLAFQFPQNDADPGVDIECRTSIGSFDPNDKTGIPLGVSDAGIIAPGTPIEYLIRFQNTGTDTAFRVEIKDALSDALDISTFKAGASSHPYHLNVSSLGVFSFVFDPISLPDSNVNWAASNGFVKFTITPKAGLASGQKIENTAQIIFDKNPPIATNKTTHTIGNPINHLTTKASEPNHGAASLKGISIAPNPSEGNILVNLSRPLTSKGLRVEIFDMLGNNIPAYTQKWPDPQNQDLQLNLESLPAGCYFISVKNTVGEIVAHGKIIKL